MEFEGDIDLGNPVNWHDPLNQGLASWWLCLPGTMGGSRFVDLVNPGAGGCHGALTNMDPVTDWVPTRRPGGWGAIQFDGHNDAVTAGLPQLTGDLTVSVWLRTDTASPVDRGIAGRWDGTGYMLWANGGNLYFFAGSGGESLNWSGGATVACDGQWHHLVGAKNGAAGALWCDGALRVSGTLPSNTGSPAVGFQMSSYNNRHITDASCWPGELDACQVFTRGLSDADIVALYHASRNYYPTQLHRVRRRVWFVPAGGAPPAASPWFHRELGRRRRAG